jgi:hypothetical protein
VRAGVGGLEDFRAYRRPNRPRACAFPVRPGETYDRRVNPTETRLVARALELARRFETEGAAELREIAGTFKDWQERRDLILSVTRAIRESPGEGHEEEGIRHLAFSLVVYAFGLDPSEP